jgi:D-amino-acid dehydrogenase
MTDVVVLGAGIVGVTTAYWMARSGKKVVVIDRQIGPALETSFANGGQVSVSHAEPWANPGAPLKVLRWLGNPEAPLLFRPKMDPRQWKWIAQFLVDCLPSRSADHTAKIVDIALLSRTLMQDVRAKEDFSYSERSKGIIHFYRNQKDFNDAGKVASLMRSHGCDCEPITTKQIVDLEPALEYSSKSIVGGTYTETDESGDAHLFTKNLADVCERMGVEFHYGTRITSLRMKNKTIEAVEAMTPDGYRTFEASEYVVCMGSHSSTFLRPIGIDLNIYPAKGYSVSIPITGLAPTVSLTDDERKIVYSNLGDTLRVAGTAELSGYSDNLNLVRCNAILENVRSLFPKAGDFDNAKFWTGLRPTTPSNLPYVCRSKVPNLLLNCGHGTLGFTMAMGTAKMVSEL